MRGISEYGMKYILDGSGKYLASSIERHIDVEHLSISIICNRYNASSAWHGIMTRGSAGNQRGEKCGVMYGGTMAYKRKWAASIWRIFSSVSGVAAWRQHVVWRHGSWRGARVIALMSLIAQQ